MDVGVGMLRCMHQSTNQEVSSDIFLDEPQNTSLDALIKEETKLKKEI